MKSLVIALFKSVTTYLVIATMVFIIVAIKSMQLSYSNFTLKSPSGHISETIFPFFAPSPETGMYTLQGTVEMGKYSSTIVRIIPDDELVAITINNVAVDLRSVPYDLRRDYTKGFVYDLKPYLHIGKNDINLAYLDSGGLMGVVMSSLPSATFVRWMFIAVSFMTLLICYQLFRKHRSANLFKFYFLPAY